MEEEHQQPEQKQVEQQHNREYGGNWSPVTSCNNVNVNANATANANVNGDDKILGVKLLEDVAAAACRLWGGSHTVFSLYLSKSKSRQAQTTTTTTTTTTKRNQFLSRASFYEDDGAAAAAAAAAAPTSHWLQGIQTSAVQAKLLQVWNFPDKETGEPTLPWGLNLGIGTTLDMERTGFLAFKLRLQSKYARLHLLPSPYFELRSRFPLGDLPVGVCFRYRLPLDDLENIWESPKAHFKVNLYSLPGTGFHLSAAGIEFDEQVVKVGKYTTFRVAASVLFPRSIPPDEGDPPFKIKVHRFGLKTRVQ